MRNTAVIAHDLVAEVTRLKRQPGKDVVQYGMGQLTFMPLKRGPEPSFISSLRSNGASPRHSTWSGSGRATEQKERLAARSRRRSRTVVNVERLRRAFI